MAAGAAEVEAAGEANQRGTFSHAIEGGPVGIASPAEDPYHGVQVVLGTVKRADSGQNGHMRLVFTHISRWLWHASLQ
jgi:hypothetical protein